MAQEKKCPYCAGRRKKINGRVAAISSHLTYGYGEREYICDSCGETWSVCYPVPPKGAKKHYIDPNPGILRVSFNEGVSGFSGKVVLTAKAPVPEFGIVDKEVPPVVVCDESPDASDEVSPGGDAE